MSPDVSPAQNRIKEAVLAAARDGRLACAVALELANKLGVPPAVIGAAADELKIKIRGCQLGCFK